MPRDITVTMQDGTQHVYKNAPDDVTPDAVTARATKEFGQGVAHLDGGKKPSPRSDLAATGVDSVRSIPGGIVKGVSGVLGLPGTLSDVASSGLDAIANKVTGNNISTANNPLSGESIGQFTAKPAGGFYEPKTPIGRDAERVASFLPAALGGPASLATRLMGRAVAPALGSRMGDDLGPVGSIGGALLGAGAFGGARALSQAVKNAKLTPEDVAQGYVANVAKNAGAQPNTGLAASLRGQTAAEALGPTGVDNLATLARRGGTTAKALSDHLTLRGASAPGRILNDFMEASGIDPKAARGDFEHLVEAGEKKAGPLYDEYYAANQNVASPKLDKILETPAGKMALADARKKMQNDMKLMGTPDAELMEQAAEGGTVLPTRGAASGMKARVYDYVKRSLDDQISAAYRGGNKNEGNILRDLKNSMVKELDDLDATGKAGPNSLKPEGGAFSRARAQAGDYLSAKEAYEEGGSHILDLKMDPRDVAAYFAKLSPSAQAAYKAGIANELLLKAGSLKLAPRLLNTPAVQQKLSAVLGENQAQTFIEAMKQESSLAASGQRMMPNTGSISSNVLNIGNEQDLADTLRMGGHFARGAADLVGGRYMSAMGNFLQGGRHIVPDLGRSGGMSEAARNKAGQTLMLPPEEFSQALQALPAPRPNIGAAAMAPYLLRKTP